MRIGEMIERFLRMFKVKDCRHVCLFCEYFSICKAEDKREENVDECEKCNEK